MSVTLVRAGRTIGAFATYGQAPSLRGAVTRLRIVGQITSGPICSPAGEGSAKGLVLSPRLLHGLSASGVGGASDLRPTATPASTRHAATPRTQTAKRM